MRPDLTRCSSCERAALKVEAGKRGKLIGVLVVLTSPRGPYALCPACAGRERSAQDLPEALAALDQELRRAAVADVLAWYAPDGTFRRPEETR